MKAKRLIDPSFISDNSPISISVLCESHPQEEIQLICSLGNCRKSPLLCWQCLLDDKEHSESHRKHFMKLSAFIDKFLEQHQDSLAKGKEQEIPSDLNSLLESESENMNEYTVFCDEQKKEIELDLMAYLKEIESFLLKSLETIKESIDKKHQAYITNYSLIKAKIEDFYGLGKEVTRDEIIENVENQKENGSVGSYFLSLKKSLLPRVPLLKDPGFTSLLKKLGKLGEKPGKIEAFSKLRKLETESLTSWERTLLQLQEETLLHYKLNLKNYEETYTLGVSTGNLKESNIGNIVSGSSNINKLIGTSCYNNNNAPMARLAINTNDNVTELKGSEAYKWSLELKKVLKTSHSKPINAIKVINEELIATGSKDKKVKVWKFYNKECLCTLEGHKDNVCCLGVLPQEKGLPLLISGGGNFDSSLIIWDLETRKAKHVLQGHQSSITTIINLNDYRTIITGSYDNNIIVWDVKEAKAKMVIRKHSAMVSSLKIIQEGSILASASWDKTIALWRMCYDEAGKFEKCDFLYSILENFAILTLSSSFLQPNRLIYAGTNKKFFAYNIENKEKEKEFEGSHFGVNELAIVESNFLENREGYFLIGISNNDSCLRMWEGDSGEQVFFVKENENAWINSMNTGPKIEVFNNFENKIQVAVLNCSETNFFVNIYDLKTGN